MTAAYLRETKAYVSTSKERGKQFSSLKYSQLDKQMAKQSFEWTIMKFNFNPHKGTFGKTFLHFCCVI